MPPLTANQFGQFGVNVDKSSLELDNSELRRAQNLINIFGTSRVRKRAGLVEFAQNAAGMVLGGTDVPLVDEFSDATDLVLYLGRGGTV